MFEIEIHWGVLSKDIYYNKKENRVSLEHIMENFEVVQITDTHLFENNLTYWNKIKPNISFLNIISQINSIKFQNLAAFFLTGDVSEDKTIKSYEFIAENLNKFNLPILWVPGNHDNIEIMKKTFKNYNNFFYQIKYAYKNWDFIFINTKVDMHEYGYIEDKTLSEIDNELKKSVGLSKHIAIIMHHHPLPVGTPLIDSMMLHDPYKFINMIKIYKENIKIILFGHVHNNYKILKYKMRFESALASSIQLIHGSKDLNFEYKSGFKVLNFSDNGKIKSTNYKINSAI